MSTLAQFDAGYNLQQDRILLRITNTDSEEYRLWLTRRLCASLINEFKTQTSAYRVKSDPDKPASETFASSADTVLQAEFEQQATAQTQNFTSRFEPGISFPLGESGLLVEKLNLKPNGKGAGVHALSFFGAEEEGMTIGVSVELFNSIFEVIERIISKANWGLVNAEAQLLNTTLQ